MAEMIGGREWEEDDEHCVANLYSQKFGKALMIVEQSERTTSNDLE